MQIKLVQIKLAAVLMVLGLTLCGCATFNRTEGLDVSIINLQFTEATVFETTAVFTVRLQNESPAPLSLEGGVHKFYLNGFFIGKGLTGESIEVPRLDSVTQQVTVRLRNITIAQRIKAIVEGQRVDYRVESLLYTRQEGRPARVRVAHDGNLDLKDFTPTPEAGR